MNIKETRILNWNDLRNLCIKHDWYTYGTNEEYSDILDFASSNEMTTENLVVIANNIIEHTNPNRFADCEPNGTTAIQYVLFELADTCKSFFTVNKSHRRMESDDFANGNVCFINK